MYDPDGCKCEIVEQLGVVTCTTGSLADTMYKRRKSRAPKGVKVK